MTTPISNQATVPTDLWPVSAAATQLQNAYAWAVDTRDWALFTTLFTPDVQATYPHTHYAGMEAWLENFIPFHDDCQWTRHAMSNHLVGQDDAGTWAQCYGEIEW